MPSCATPSLPACEAASHEDNTSSAHPGSTSVTSAVYMCNPASSSSTSSHSSTSAGEPCTGMHPLSRPSSMCEPPTTTISSSSSDDDDEDTPPDAPLSLCRVCWEPSDERDGGLLLSPCSCRGSVQHIHLRCLQRWQLACKARGHQSRGRRCDLCAARFVVSFPGMPRTPSLLDLAASTSSALKRTHLPDLALRTYLAATALRVLTSGASASLSGASRGMLLGAHLIDRQLSLLLHSRLLRTFVQPGLFLVPTFCCFPFYVQLASLQLLATTTAGLLLGGCSGALASVRTLALWHADVGTVARRRLGAALLHGISSIARGVLQMFCRAK